MKYTNIFEKLTCVFNIVKDNWSCLAFLCFVGFFLILLGRKKITKKVCFISVLMTYFAFLGYNIFTYNKELAIVGDNLANNLFTNIYFPSTYTYLFVLIVMDVVTITSLLSKKGSNVYKWIHGIFFFMIQFVFVLILELLSKNKIYIFYKTSLFSNKYLVMEMTIWKALQRLIYLVLKRLL